jgi:hypothetical protein
MNSTSVVIGTIIHQSVHKYFPKVTDIRDTYPLPHNLPYTSAETSHHLEICTPDPLHPLSLPLVKDYHLPTHTHLILTQTSIRIHHPFLPDDQAHFHHTECLVEDEDMDQVRHTHRIDQVIHQAGLDMTNGNRRNQDPHIYPRDRLRLLGEAVGLGLRVDVVDICVEDMEQGGEVSMEMLMAVSEVEEGNSIMDRI